MRVRKAIQQPKFELYAKVIACLFAAATLTSCTQMYRMERMEMLKAARFDDAITVTCKLGSEPLPQRIAAAKELLLALDASSDITAGSPPVTNTSPTPGCSSNH